MIIQDNGKSRRNTIITATITVPGTDNKQEGMHTIQPNNSTTPGQHRNTTYIFVPRQACRRCFHGTPGHGLLLFLLRFPATPAAIAPFDLGREAAGIQRQSSRLSPHRASSFFLLSIPRFLLLLTFPLSSPHPHSLATALVLSSQSFITLAIICLIHFLAHSLVSTSAIHAILA